MHRYISTLSSLAPVNTQLRLPLGDIIPWTKALKKEHGTVFIRDGYLCAGGVLGGFKVTLLTPEEIDMLRITRNLIDK